MSTCCVVVVNFECLMSWWKSMNKWLWVDAFVVESVFESHVSRVTDEYMLISQNKCLCVWKSD
jgi:hypothetical protein